MPIDAVRGPAETVRSMCLVFLLALFAPRVAFLLMWIFGTRVDHAFDTWLIPLLGLMFVPWASIVYTMLWHPVTGVEGFAWAFIVIAAMVDLISWSSRMAGQRSLYS